MNRLSYTLIALAGGLCLQTSAVTFQGKNDTARKNDAERQITELIATGEYKIKNTRNDYIKALLEKAGVTTTSSMQQVKGVEELTYDDALLLSNYVENMFSKKLALTNAWRDQLHETIARQLKKSQGFTVSRYKRLAMQLVDAALQDQLAKHE
ncbi:MAG: hypothetical protein UU47_C0017G0004 [candidate division TM6 bacterium GW2011_GWE2_41_16]|nr:MAG: hypothetical protein UU47_C0017G0004 [candidate division TM6 bacterium GW2011_GWE2_41_16]